MKLYYATGTSSLGIRLILEEIGQPYEAERIDLASQQQLGAAYCAINPKGKVPVIIGEGQPALTEFPVIAQWLARSFPDARLLPDELESQMRVLEALEYIVSTIHMQGFLRMFRPLVFNPDQTKSDEVKAQGRAIVEKALSILEGSFRDGPYVNGQYSIADAALFFVEFWAIQRLNLPVPTRFSRHFETVAQRPAGRRALLGEAS